MIWGLNTLGGMGMRCGVLRYCTSKLARIVVFHEQDKRGLKNGGRILMNAPMNRLLILNLSNPLIHKGKVV